MKTTIFFICMLLNWVIFSEGIQESYIDISKPGMCMFDIPTGWKEIDSMTLTKHVQVFVKAPIKNTLAPSINLATEPVSVSISEFVMHAKKLYSSTKSYIWKDVGIIKTQAGEAHLALIDSISKFGPAKIIQAIIINNSIAYTLTTCCLKKDFPIYQKYFFQAIRSFTIGENVFKMVDNVENREKLIILCDELIKAWLSYYDSTKENCPALSNKDISQKTFYSKAFQQKQWLPFVKKINDDFSYMGNIWQKTFFQNIKKDYLSCY